MKTYNNLWDEICSLDNLEKAYKKAKKGKTSKPYVIEFEKNLYTNLSLLRFELFFQTYIPKPLKTFVIQDPKTRVISKSDFRDRIVHHALCNVIEPKLERTFIYDSYANRKGKGTLKAVQRFEQFKRKISKNNNQNYLVLKADIKHYFENINRDILLNQIKIKIQDPKVIWLIQLILNNNSKRKGMPLGNLTSQFFANVYLNELDQYVKQDLKVQYYIRYVDDFVILSATKEELESLKENINLFLKNKLELELHPEKSKILSITQGVTFLGFRIFEYHKLLKKSNLRKFKLRLKTQELLFKQSLIDFDTIYNSFLGWNGYAKQANTSKLISKISERFKTIFENETPARVINSFS